MGGVGQPGDVCDDADGKRRHSRERGRRGSARRRAEPGHGSTCAARFPFINPLATVVPVNAAEGAGTIGGHLADGGYHDNSGAESLTDAWRALRAAKLPANWHPQLVLIRNGQLKPGCDTEGKKEPEARCLSEAPVRRPIWRRH